MNRRQKRVISIACDKLIEFTRQRRWLMKRHDLIERPSIQHISSQLTKEGVELVKQELYKRASDVRKIGLKVINPDWPEIPFVSFDEDARSAIKSRVLRANGKEIDPIDLKIVCYMSIAIASEIAAVKRLKSARKIIENEIEDQASRLHVAEWWRSLPGCNLLGLGTLIGETGDLFDYPNPDKVKKRLGLAPYKGKACSTWKSKGGLKSEEWADQEDGPKYCPRRCAVAYVIGTSIILKKKEPGNYFYKIFADEKKRKEDAGWGVQPLHRDRHARRYMMQQVVIELWCKWHDKEAWGRHVNPRKMETVEA